MCNGSQKHTFEKKKKISSDTSKIRHGLELCRETHPFMAQADY